MMNSSYRSAICGRLCPLLLVSLLGLAMFAKSALAREEWYRGLDLESGLAKASLVMAARVAEVTETKLVLGGKVEQPVQQFQFEPLQVLKGVYSRQALLLTGNELGGYQFGNATRRIERNQVRLLVLGRSGQGYTLQPTAPSLDHALPPLRDGSDPLVEAVKILLSVEASHDRAGKVERLLGGLRSLSGPAAVPLLASLQRRALIGAQTRETVPAVAKHLSDSSPAVREAAAKTLHSLLDADYLDQQSMRETAVKALATAFGGMDGNIAARVATIDALGAGGVSASENGLVRGQLRLARESRTFAERAAQLRAIGRLQMNSERQPVLALLERLPHDATGEIQSAAEWALARLDPGQGVEQIRIQTNNKVSSGLPVQAEIETLGELTGTVTVPLLLEISKLPLDWTERLALAAACEKIADPRLVSVLAGLLDPREPETRWQAVEALKKINTVEAARALQPHLLDEANLLRKLETAELLGRHGMRDGYPFAIEHMSEPSLRQQAVEALAAIRDPRSGRELREILRTSNDPAWNSAAVLALGRLGERELGPQFLEIIQDLKHPLAPAALVALGDLAEVRALARVREGLNSRNPELVTASARAAGRLLAIPQVQAEDLRDQLAALLANADAPPEARAAALESLVRLKDARLDQALVTAVRDAGLEGSRLLEQIEKTLRDRKVRLRLG